MEENLKIDPPVEDLSKSMDDVIWTDVLVSRFSKTEIHLGQSRDHVAPADVSPLPGGEESGDLIKVIDAKTGETEFISRYDSRYYSADGFKTRRYRNV